MKTCRAVPLALLYLSILSAQLSILLAQGPAFTYQGRLSSTGQPANGSYDVRADLYDAALGGSQLGSTVLVPSVAVSNGLFTVSLNFGAGVFTGTDRWLELAVRTNGAGAFTTLSPRQPLTASPYALYAPNAGVAAAVPAGSITSAALAEGAVTAGKLASNAVSSLAAPDGSPLSAVQVNTNGLVGIGTDTPSAGLHITSSGVILAPRVLFERTDESMGYTNLFGARAVAVTGNLLAVAAEYDHGITLLDITDPQSPVLRSQFRDGDGSFTNLNEASGVAMKPGLLVVTARADHAVTLVNVSDPATPVKLAELRDGVGGWNELMGASAVAISGNLMAVAAFDDSAVTLADISNPAAPVLRAVLKQGQFGFTNLAGAQSVAISGSLMAIGAYSSSAVTLVDVSNPASPIKLAELRDGEGGFTSLNRVNSVALSGNLLAIAAISDNAVTLVSVSNPANPIKLAEWRHGIDGVNTLSWATSVAFSGNWLAASAWLSAAVTLWDISDPFNPKMAAVARDGVAGFRRLTDPKGIAFAGTNLAVAGSRAVTLMDFRPATAGLVSQERVGIGTALPQATLHVVGDVVVEADHFDVNAKQLELGFGAIASGIPATAIGNGAMASGNYSTAIGNSTRATSSGATAIGHATIAGGLYSTALGYFAAAEHDGTLVWADYTMGNFRSTAPNQFLIRASGGVGIGTTAPGAALDVAPAPGIGGLKVTGNRTGGWNDPIAYIENTGVSADASPALRLVGNGGQPHGVLSVSQQGTGLIARFGNNSAFVSRLDADGNWFGTSFNPSSDRDAKENIRPIDSRQVLEKVVSMPISEWNFKQDTAATHIGPMAQDFHAAFGLGKDNKHIATVDADGVALAAIQGLNQKVEEQRAELKQKQTEITELKERLEKLETLIRNGGGK
jgi:hypothetical protein